MDDPALSEWIASAKQSVITKEISRFRAKDKFGVPVLIELKIVDKECPELKDLLERFSIVASQAMTPSETQFLKANSNLPFEDELFKEFEPLFIKGESFVDWGLVEEKMRARIKRFFGKDPSAFSPSVLYIFGEIKNIETQVLQGVISFGISPSMRYGDIKLTNIAIIPALQNRGMGKLLISSIFKIIPQIKRIVLTIRPTNKQALTAYSALGFIEDLNPIRDVTHNLEKEQFVFWEYRTDTCNLLQDYARSFIHQ